MEDKKYLCGQCNSGYKNRSSLRRHINIVHNDKRYICGNCNKAYARKADYIKHITKYHQPLICTQAPENIEYSAKQQPSCSNNQNINKTTDVLTGQVNWEQILKEDLALSDDDDTPPVKISIATNTDIAKKSIIKLRDQYIPIGHC